MNNYFKIAKLLILAVLMGLIVSPWNTVVIHAQNDQQIVYASGKLGARQLYIMDADGSNPRQLTKTGDNAEPNWSPDRRFIAFSSQRNDVTDIYSIAADGSNEQQVTQNNGTFNAAPSWSPDGQWIAFVSNRNSKMDVFMVKAAGGDIRPLTNDNTTEFTTPAWSPSGRQIALASNKTGHAEIWLINNDGSGLSQLTKNTDGDYDSPAWSPDGKRIAYQGNQGSDSDVYVMDANGANVELVLSVTGKYIGSISWSPDGQSLAFMVWANKGLHGIESVPVNGNGITRQLTDGKDDAGWPSWASLHTTSAIALDGNANSSSSGAQGCSNSPPSRLAINMIGRVTYDPPDPSDIWANPGSGKIATMPPGTSFTVIAGPICVNNLTWWTVQWKGIQGWTAEGKEDTYWLEPLPNPPLNFGTTCPNFAVTRLAIGKKARILRSNSKSDTSKPLRSAPSSPNIIVQIPLGTIVEVIGGPSCSLYQKEGGIAWWKVRYGSIVGWVSEGIGDLYYMEPAT